MELEIELKLITEQQVMTQFEQQTLPLIGGKLTKKRFNVENDYFDTAEQTLSKHKIGYRIRTVDGVIEQTVKTQGKAEGGLHHRPEYNLPLAQAAPDLTQFESQVWPSDFDVAQVNANLVRLFSTHFQRTAFLIELPKATVEVVFDEGEVSSSHGSLPISEIELELKKGDARVLFNIADDISQLAPVRVSNVSKAAKGYQLVNSNPPSMKKLPKFLPMQRKISTEDGFCRALQCALSHWQHHEYVYLQRGKTKALQAIAQSIRYLLQSVSLYLPVLQCKEMLQLHKQLIVLAEQWTWQEDLQSIRALMASNGPFSRKIPKHQSLVSYLNGRKEGLLSVQSPDQLLLSFESSVVQLSASRMLFEKPWRNTADGYGKPVMLHAKGWLSQGWQAVKQSLPINKPLGATNYLAIEALLRQTLINGFLVADLFDEGRGQFRAPWLDLLDGIEELKALFFLSSILEELELDDRTEFDEWISDKTVSLITVMEMSRAVAMRADIYW